MKIKENIKKLLKSDITAYRISKETGISESQLSRMKKGEIEIGRITLDNAIKLNEFWEENKMGSVEGKKIAVVEGLNVKDLRDDLERYGNRRLVDELRRQYKTSESHIVATDEGEIMNYIIFKSLLSDKETMIVYNTKSAIFGNVDFEVFTGDEVKEKLEKDKSPKSI